MEIITGEPRRRWSREQKLAAVAATFEPDATVAGVARQIGANTGMVFSWRKQFRAELGFPELAREVGFAPVMLTGPSSSHPEQQPASTLGMIEIAFTDGVRLKLTGAVEPGLASAVTKALTRR